MGGQQRRNERGDKVTCKKKKRRVVPPNPNFAHVVIVGKSGREDRASSVLLKSALPLLQVAALPQAALHVVCFISGRGVGY